MSAIECFDVEYLRRGDEPLLARIYRPTGSGPFPAVVSVHGGGWVGNDRLSNQVFDRGLAERGLVVVAIDFRLPPQWPYPASITDINFAVRWLKQNAHRYATKPNLVGALGTSSGGHQLLLAAMRPNDVRYRSEPLEGGDAWDATLNSLVLCWPIVDPADRYALAKQRGAEDMLRMQDAYFVTEPAMQEADPLRCLERRDDIALPPTLLIDGGADDRVTPTGINRFVAAYSSAGGFIQHERFQDQGHTFVIKDPAAAASIRAMDLIASFVLARTTGAN